MCLYKKKAIRELLMAFFLQTLCFRNDIFIFDTGNLFNPKASKSADKRKDRGEQTKEDKR